MGPLDPLQNFVFMVGVLVSGIFLALITYGYLKEKDEDTLSPAHFAEFEKCYAPDPNRRDNGAEAGPDPLGPATTAGVSPRP